ncbi:MAG: ABC transporter permease, partial [Hymenobacteraceae bacterium]|nr:ABC transporter permease [Hymenobacteraceae bacterium]
MLRNYLKTAYRNLFRHKAFSLINISGLALGLTACLLIGLFVYDELQYDRFVPEGDRVYRLYNDMSAREAG